MAAVFDVRCCEATAQPARRRVEQAAREHGPAVITPMPRDRWAREVSSYRHSNSRAFY